MELAGAVVAVRRVAAGTGMSYGYLQRTERETTLALVSLGYADGVPRAASGKASVAINGVRYPPGRPHRDGPVASSTSATTRWRSATASCSGATRRPDAPSAADWARAAGTIGYEIVTRVGSRVPRIFVGEPDAG